MEIKMTTKFDVGEEVLVCNIVDGITRWKRRTISEIRWMYFSYNLGEQEEPFYKFREQDAGASEADIRKLPEWDRRPRLTKRVTDSQGNPCVIVNDYRPQSIQSISVYERLAELEDAIESGILVEQDI